MKNYKTLYAYITLVVVLTFFYADPPNAAAQLDRTRYERYLKKKKTDEKDETLQDLSKSKSVVQTVLNKEALESVIDPERYLMGPGDQLLISIWGQVNESFPARVSPEGMILIPTVKEIDVRGLTLTGAKARIIGEMKKVYTAADVSVSLVSVRSFRVNVTGLTLSTGSFVVTAVDRVSDAVKMAGGIIDSNMASLRNIVVYRKPDTVLLADLIKRSNAGDLQYDPVLMDGDVIYVPPVYSWVYIHGGVQLPGKYEYVKNEPLSELVKVAGGLQFGIDSTLVEITRFQSDTGRTYQYIKTDYRQVIRHSQDSTVNIILQPNDRVLFKLIPQFQEKHNVTIRGEIRYPGVYPIVDNRTKLSDVVAMAGGFTRDVSLDNIIIYRDIKYEGRDLEYERLLQTPVMDMNDIEKAYFKAKSRQYYPTVQTDFTKLFSAGKPDPKYDVFLKDRDVIEVGRKKRTVRVVGGVIAPGIIDIVDGENFTYYIEKAGGYSTRAKKGDTRIIRPSSQSWIDASKKIPIEDGDVIFIPEKEPVDGWRIFRETVAMVGQLASITATIILIYYTVK